MLLPEMHARHVVRGIDDEEQDEGQDVDPEQQGKGVEDAAEDVVDHSVKPGIAAIRLHWLEHRLQVAYPDKGQPQQPVLLWGEPIESARPALPSG
jgi:hypothetical protein